MLPCTTGWCMNCIWYDFFVEFLFRVIRHTRNEYKIMHISYLEPFYESTLISLILFWKWILRELPLHHMTGIHYQKKLECEFNPRKKKPRLRFSKEWPEMWIQLKIIIKKKAFTSCCTQFTTHLLREQSSTFTTKISSTFTALAQYSSLC